MALESNAKNYCRDFPGTYVSASGGWIRDKNSRKYLDFLSGCGALNYGHNHPILKEALIRHITNDGLSMSLDLETDKKLEFMESFSNLILKPREMNYRLQFTGPTGANAVEAAIKLARKVTNRTKIISFTNAFHGCSLGALSLTGSSYHRKSSEALLSHVMHLPYDNYFGTSIDTSEILEKLLSDPSSDYDLPAAIIVETIQGEGGLNTCSHSWITKICSIAKRIGALTIIDDIQAGCGRSGSFFSFEGFELSPDIIVLAKSLSGYGIPMSLVLFKPDLDHWLPGEHNGTFRGNAHAFVTANESIKFFWKDNKFAENLLEKATVIKKFIKNLEKKYPIKLKGRGLMQGISFSNSDNAEHIKNKCFREGLIIENSGSLDEVIKIMPPLTLIKEELKHGLDIIADGIQGLFL